jgi:hypothetical protein
MSYVRPHPPNCEGICSTSNGIPIVSGGCRFRRSPCPCRTWSGSFNCVVEVGRSIVRDQSARSSGITQSLPRAVLEDAQCGPSTVSACDAPGGAMGRRRLPKAWLLSLHEVGVKTSRARRTRRSASTALRSSMRFVEPASRSRLRGRRRFFVAASRLIAVPALLDIAKHDEDAYDDRPQ